MAALAIPRRIEVIDRDMVGLISSTGMKTSTITYISMRN